MNPNDFPARLKKHRDRLNLSKKFPDIDAAWMGADAQEFRQILCDMTHFCDHTTVETLAPIMDATDALSGGPGDNFNLMMAERRESNTWRENLDPIISMLDRGSREGLQVYWNHVGAQALIHVLDDMLDLVFVRFPKRLDIELARLQIAQQLRDAECAL